MISSAILLTYSSLFVLFVTNYVSCADDHEEIYPSNTIETVDSINLKTNVELYNSVLETKFLLYTRNNNQSAQQLFIDDLDSVKSSFWNSDHPTRIVVHGWKGNTGPKSVGGVVKDAYLDAGDYNVIVIDWETMSRSMYHNAVKSVPMLARHIAEMIDFLQREADLDPKIITMIGYSLGGHVVGLAARYANGEIAEVVALDPAKTFYEFKGPGERVDKSDATLVQVIHTTDTAGLSEELGHSDFYPNSGKNQPGCMLIDTLCKHARSYMYYAESIGNPTGFRAGDVFMGGPTLDSRAHGRYTLKTAGRSPFALG